MAAWVGRFAPVSEIDITNHSGRVAAVDALNWVTQLSTGVQSGTADTYIRSDGRNVAHVLGTIRGVRKYVRAAVPLVFVFDGAFSAEIRQWTDPNRQSDETPYPQQEFFQRSLQRTLDGLGVPYVEYPFDGEAGAASLNRCGYADFVLSNDWDALLYGAEVLVRNFTGSDPEELANLRGLLAEHGITREELIDIAIVVGTEYNDGLNGISAESALDGLRMYGSLEELQARADGSLLDPLDELRELMRDPPPIDPRECGLPEPAPPPDPRLEALERALRDCEVPPPLIDEELRHLERAVQASDRSPVGGSE